MSRMKEIGLLFAGAVFGAASLYIAEPWNPLVLTPDADGTVTEQVEQVIYRTELPHDGCFGFWRQVGRAEKIEAYGIDKHVFTHVCSECGLTNRIYDACWPRFRREWRAVR